MQGDGKERSGQAGIIQLAAADLFRFMRQGEAAQREFLVKVSYFELYNEKIRDLLSDDTDSAASNGGLDKRNTSGSSNLEEDVKIRTNAEGEIVMNVIQNEVSNVDEVLELLVRGNHYRVVAATDMNTHSSRSHAVFRITVESRSKEDEPNLFDTEIHDILRVADFNLVDLAGSESVKLTNTNTVARQREGGKINKSLLALTSVIHSLSQPENKRPKHINYRDSKLTRILQPHLSGNAEMAILCCASPAKTYIEETRSTLKFAARARLVEMKPKVNEISDDSGTIKRLQHELAEARKMIEELRMQQQRSANSMDDSSNDASLGYGDMNQNAKHENANGNNGYEDSTNSYPRNDGPGYSMPQEASMREEEYYEQGDYEVPDASMPQDEPMPQEYYEQEGYDMPDGSMPQDEAVPQEYYEQEGYEMPNAPMPREESIREEEFYEGGHEMPNANMQKPLNDGRRAYVMPKNHALQGMDFQGSRHSQASSEAWSEASGDDVDLNASAAGFQLDVAEPRVAKKAVQRYMKGHGSMDLDDAFNFSGSTAGEADMQGQQLAAQSPPREHRMPDANGKPFGSPDKFTEATVRTEEETFVGAEASYSANETQVSYPETIQGTAVGIRSTNPRLRTVDAAGEYAQNGRLENSLSWDTMELNTTRPQQVGQPLGTLQSRTTNETPIPDEVMIISASITTGNNESLTARLNDAEDRIKFLEHKLETSNDLIEGTFRDLERARICIHDLVHRNVEMMEKLKEKRREEEKEDYEQGEALVEQYWILRGSVYASLFFFVSGGHELFLASVFFVWLMLETNLAGE